MYILVYKQTVYERGTKMEKGFLNDKGQYNGHSHISFTAQRPGRRHASGVQRTDAKEVENGFLKLPCGVSQNSPFFKGHNYIVPLHRLLRSLFMQE